MRQIDENLRRVYQQTAEEDVPEHLKELLRKLREQDATRTRTKEQDGPE